MLERRTPELVVLLVLALLLGGYAVAGGGEEGPAGGAGDPAAVTGATPEDPARALAPRRCPPATDAPAPSSPPPAASAEGDPGTTGRLPSVRTIARRVEAIRGLRFRELPEPEMVSPAEARRTGLADLDRRDRARRLAADAEVLKLLGLLAPCDDLRTISASIFGEGVAGFYDPRTDRLAVVRGAGDSSPALAEITLAHELVHALEDQRFAIEEPPAGTDDGATAQLALVEGTATSVMFEYATRHLSPAALLGTALSGGATPDLPPYVERSLVFPYLQGMRFVDAVRRTGGWPLVDLALRTRPPASTEHVLHPDLYLRGEPVADVPLDVAGALGAGWERATTGTLGEQDTREILRGAEDPEAGARGWAGGRFALHRRAPAPAGCPSPCVAGDALVVAWRWDRPADAAEADAALTEALVTRLGARPRDGGFALRAGAVVTARRGTSTVLALAPDRATADRLARRALP